MKKIKKAYAGMTLVEVIVAMAIFAIMFLMIFGIMISSVYLNASTRNYDQETDIQVADAENYNPMGAYINDDTNAESNEIENYSVNGFTVSFPVYGAINVNAQSYQVKSKSDENGFSLKFFNSVSMDPTKRCWIRITNVSDDDDLTVYFYLPEEGAGQFYLRNGNKPYTSVVSKVVPKNTSLGLGYDFEKANINKNPQSAYFWVSLRSDLTQDDLNHTTDGCVNHYNFKTVINPYMDANGYLDIYITGNADDGYNFLTLQDYKDSLDS